MEQKMMEKITKRLLAADLGALVLTAMMLESTSSGVLTALLIELALLAFLIFAGVQQGI